MEIAWVGVAILAFLVGYRTGEYYPRAIAEDEVFERGFREGFRLNPRACSCCMGTGYNMDESPCDSCFGVGFETIHPNDSALDTVQEQKPTLTD